MRSALVTGGSGFFGGILKRALLERGWSVVNIDLVKDEDSHVNLVSVQGDIRDKECLEKVFQRGKYVIPSGDEGRHAASVYGSSPLTMTQMPPFDCIFHCAAILAHAVKDPPPLLRSFGGAGKQFLWESNVDGTRNVAEAAKAHGVRHFVFTSSNCLWGEGFGRPVREDDAPNPVEIYGKSKWEGEKILNAYEDAMNVVIIRCPTIVDAGRLGLLSILFEFIDEGRKVWVVGGGKNVYQFIAAPDLVEACIKAADFHASATFNIGSDNVKSFREVYDSVIRKAGTKARVANLPRNLTIATMKIAYALGLSPLGPYQYKMIAEDFVFDTSRIKEKLGWKPTITNEEMLWRAYEYYRKNRADIESRTDASAHRSGAKMGVIRVLKWFS